MADVTNLDSPFVAGAEVYIQTSRYGYGCSYRAAKIEKVHKNGNFCLVDDKQQWRPWHNSYDASWGAHQTGRDSYSRATVIPMNDKTRAEVQIEQAREARRDRLDKLQKQIERLKPDDITEAALGMIEAALKDAAEGKL